MEKLTRSNLDRVQDHLGTDPKPSAVDSEDMTFNSALRPGVIYSDDNGRRICIKCAGQCAYWNGTDLHSGYPLHVNTAKDAANWLKWFGIALTCEKGCTTF